MVYLKRWIFIMIELLWNHSEYGRDVVFMFFDLLISVKPFQTIILIFIKYVFLFWTFCANNVQIYMYKLLMFF